MFLQPTHEESIVTLKPPKAAGGPKEGYLVEGNQSFHNRFQIITTFGIVGNAPAKLPWQSHNGSSESSYYQACLQDVGWEDYSLLKRWKAEATLGSLRKDKKESEVYWMMVKDR